MRKLIPTLAAELAAMRDAARADPPTAWQTLTATAAKAGIQ